MTSEQTGRGNGQPASGLSPEVTSILAKYGEAMLRLAQVERELDHLRQQVQTQPHPAAPAASATPAPGLSEALQAKEKELRRKDETIASLRVHISTLTSQLEKTEQRLKEAATGNYMMYRARRRKWWQFWRKSHQSRS